MTITGNCGKRFLISASNCGPSMPGMRQSLTSRSQSLGSSSTTSTLCVIACLVEVFTMGRNVQAEGRPGIFFAGAFDAPVMVFHDRKDLGQAQPGAGGLGRDKRGENSFEHVWLNAHAGVRHADHG